MNDAKLDPEDPWVLINEFVNHNSLVQHHISSFDHAIQYDIPKVLREGFSITVDKGPGGNDSSFPKVWRFTFVNPLFGPPDFTENDNSRHPVTPIECVWRKLTYESPLYTDVCVTLTDATGQTYNHSYEKIQLCNLPIMVNSCLCVLSDMSSLKSLLAERKEDVGERGGYFIINGSRKAMISQERPPFNILNVYKNHKKVPRYITYAEVRSIENLVENHTTTTKCGITKDGSLTFMIPYIPIPVPMSTVFNAMGIFNTTEFFERIYSLYPEDKGFRNVIFYNLEKHYKRRTNEAAQDEALKFIGRNGKRFLSTANSVVIRDDEDEILKYATHILEREFLSHIQNYEDKKLYVGYMIVKMLRTHLRKEGTDPVSVAYNERFKRRYHDDRDNLYNKRIITSGMMVAEQFYIAYKKLRDDVRNSIQKAVKNRSQLKLQDFLTKYSGISKMMQSAVKRGNWTIKGAKEKGISQTYEMGNKHMTAAFMRKSSTPMSGEGLKIINPRLVHGSAVSSWCPAETPEGKQVGLNKNFALMNYVTVGEEHYAITRIIKAMEYVKPLSGTEELTKTKVLVNGRWIGVTDGPEPLTSTLKKLKSTCTINQEISIAYNPWDDEIVVWTDCGRMMRPLLSVKDGKLLLKPEHVEKILNKEMVWTDLLNQEIVEYIDKYEEEFVEIANYPLALDTIIKDTTRIDYSEFHPSMMFGVSASLTQYAEHTQAPRVCYAASMTKQSHSIPCTNYLHQFMNMNSQWYLNKPLVMTKGSLTFEYDKYPSGHNATVAIVEYNGYSQEDSLIINADSCQRGFLTCNHFTEYYLEVREDMDECFGLPDPAECSGVMGDTSKLDEDFVVGIGATLVKGDVIIGKIKRVKTGRKKYESLSKVYEHEWPTVVEKVQRSTNGDGYPYIRVLCCQKREIIEGDKLCSSMGQKGTCGKKQSAINMPFIARNGVVPDILFNSLALPSRMTINQLILAITGKVAAVTSPLRKVTVSEFMKASQARYRARQERGLGAVKVDGTSFNDETDLEEVYNELGRMGFQRHGREVMIDGETGKPLVSMVYCGPVYYQRLHHMAVDKIHARSIGGRMMLTRQPPEGRSAQGGLRVGVMESDVFRAQGATEFLRDRMMICSDEYKLPVCKSCGLEAILGPDIAECRVCNITGRANIKQIRIPYGTKLAMQELRGMNVHARYLPKNEEL